MRARLAFLLTALTLLFLLQGLAAWFGTLFALTSEAVFAGRSSAWFQMALPLITLLAPAVPLARRFGRERLLVWAAATAALARVALCFPDFEVRWIASALVVAGGFTFLSAAVGCLSRRAVTAGAATALLLEQVLRFAGTGWDVTLRPGVAVFAQVVLSAAAAGIAGYWLLAAESGAQHERDSLERRAGGLRLRGAVVLACVLFLELTVLARPAVVSRLTGLPYDMVALTLIAVTALAVVLHTRVQLPPRAHRPLMTGCALLAGAAASLAPRIGGAAAGVLLMFAHAAALALLARALIPGGGRRKGWTSAVAAFLLLGLVVVHGLTFFAAFTIPALHGHGPAVYAAAGGLLTLAVLLLPRPAGIAAFVSRMPTALSAAAFASVLLLGLTRARASESAPREPAPDVTVATFNVHLGYDHEWRFDPERIARTIETSGADVVALQEAPAGLLLAYGIDLPLWLARRLDMHARFAPSKGGLLGDALLARHSIVAFESRPLPALDGDPKQLFIARVEAGADTLVLAGTHFGLTDRQQRAQAAAALRRLQHEQRAVLAGDLNATSASTVARALQDAGFSDAFAAAGMQPEATWPAHMPSARIDWLWVRGYDVRKARTSAGGGSDHRLVAATLRLPRIAGESTTP